MKKPSIIDYLDSDEYRRACEASQAAERKRQDEITNHPDNGKAGWWTVYGIRHEWYGQASSASEAIQLAEDEEQYESVQDWEFPRAHYLGEEMPPVVETWRNQ